MKCKRRQDRVLSPFVGMEGRVTCGGHLTSGVIDPRIGEIYGFSK